MHEGEFVARWLPGRRQLAAFVLRYELKDSPYKIDVHAREDGQRAVRLVRSRAAEWKLDPAKVGIMGFSAGGETVGLVLKVPGEQPDAADPVDKLRAKPAFQARRLRSAGCPQRRGDCRHAAGVPTSRRHRRGGNRAAGVRPEATRGEGAGRAAHVRQGTARVRLPPRRQDPAAGGPVAATVPRLARHDGVREVSQRLSEPSP